MFGHRAQNRGPRLPGDKRIMLGALYAASAAIIFTIPVAAAVDDGSDIIETVYVTARKQSEDSQKVPLPVNVLSGQALSDSNDTQIQQLPLKVPGLTVTGSNGRQINFAIRGLGNNPTSNGLSSSVGVYIDGVYLDRPGMAAFDLLDIDQVEVLRGPQGTLFGKNTTAGAITIATVAPMFEYGAGGAIRVGDLGFHQVHFAITGPLSDVLAFRLSGYDTDRNGYVNDIYNGNHLLGLHRQGVRGQLLYRPGPTLSWRMIAEYGRQQDSSGASVVYSKGPAQSANPTYVPFDTWTRFLGIAPPIDPSRLESSDNAQQQISERQYAITSLATWQLGTMTIDSVTGWRDWRYRPHIDGDYTSADVIADNGSMDIDRQFSEELRLTGTMPEINYVIGGYFFSRSILGNAFSHFGSQYSQGLGVLGNPALNNSTSNTYTNISNLSYAAFLQATWQFAPQWNLTAGLRETFERELGAITRPALTGGNGPVPANFGAYNGNFSTNEWTPSALLSLDYDIGNSVLIYAISSYGAKAGGFNPVAPPFGNGTFEPIDTLKVKPEETADLEVGMKSELLDRHVMLNLNGYSETVFGYQTSALALLPDLTRKNTLTNVGSVRSQGVEADLTVRILSGIELSSSLTYNDAHYGTFRNGPAVEGSTSLSQDLSHRPLVLAPAWSFFAGLRYTRLLAPGISGFLEAELGLRSGYYGYVDDSVYSHVPGNSIENLQVGLTIERADVALWIKNISNAISFYPVFPAGTGAGGYFANPSEPRTFGITLQYKVE
jgi:iron complex outermembrane receptor protein